jgi:hypothetical protein
LASILVNSYDPNNGFLIIDVTPGRKIGWRKFSSPQALNSNHQSKVILQADGVTDLDAPFTESHLRYFFGFEYLSLFDGGFGWFSTNINTMKTNNGELTIVEFYARFLEPNATEFSQPYLLYTTKTFDTYYQYRIYGIIMINSFQL